MADLLFWRWLKRLGERREWAALLEHYQPTTNAEIRCYQLRALYGTGKREEAFAQVADLWVVEESQPKACDPLFEAWIANEYLTYAMAWERLQLALDNDERQLARYLLRFFDGSHKSWAQSLYNLHLNPSAVTRTSRYAKDTENSRRAIRHGLLRLASRDPERATQAWEHYRQSHAFTDADRLAIEDTLMKEMASEGVFRNNPRSTDVSGDLAQAMATAAIAYSNWPQAQHWLELLPAEQLQSNRWQYWLTRALSASTLNSERARLAYRALADERDYYGFLAAERLGVPPQLNGVEAQPQQATREAVRNLAAVARATELHAVGDLLNARRELNTLITTLQPDQQAALAHLVMDMGWLSQSIHLANTAKLRDHLTLRFPTVHHREFQRVSHATTIDHPFLIAIARQESTFDRTARSSADARGLMQLLHSTATATARRARLRLPDVSDLYTPHVNIEISGHHLAELLLRYDNSRPLAAAAYNAGPSRVDRWIRQASGMPMDIWIETIPFRETRNYVKNVLAFAQVYGQLLQTPSPTLHAHEAAVP